MLTVEENERMTRVGTGTPMGKYLRRFWWPALPVDANCRSATARRCACGCWARTSSRSATPTGASAWSMPIARTAARRCSSAATRKTACAASTTAGSSIVTATASTCRRSRPARRFRRKVKILAYPTVEKGGVIWTYMGPKESSPRRPITNGLARPRRTATCRRPSRTATGFRRWKAGLTPRTPPSRTTTSSATAPICASTTARRCSMSSAPTTATTMCRRAMWTRANTTASIIT